MPLSNPNYSKLVLDVLGTIQTFMCNVLADHRYAGIVLDDSMADPRVVAYLSDSETGVLTLQGDLTRAYLDSPNGARLVNHYRVKGFHRELSSGMKFYAVCISKIDIIAAAAQRGEVNPDLGMQT